MNHWTVLSSPSYTPILKPDTMRKWANGFTNGSKRVDVLLWSHCRKPINSFIKDISWWEVSFSNKRSYSLYNGNQHEDVPWLFVVMLKLRLLICFISLNWMPWNTNIGFRMTIDVKRWTSDRKTWAEVWLTIQSLQIKISHYFDSITYELLFLICNEAEQVLFAGYLKNYTWNLPWRNNNPLL